MPTSTSPIVVVIDDEEPVIEMFRVWLQDEYTVLGATSGKTALDLVDDSVDVVLLDRRMQPMSGDEVLHRLRARGCTAMVAMISAMTPEADIKGLPFDDYIVKPTRKAEVTGVVELLLERSRYSERIQQCYRLLSKLTTLEQTFSDDYLRGLSVYHELQNELSVAQAQADESLKVMIADGGVDRVYLDL